ncbi:hypothetical protein VCRA2120O333_90093 [Vibrio crassostreae]|nr:hypothetical protein VCRA2119O381_130017 [Vibrio crassostreae]CAK1871566.1 hypothetical protein VCRA2113O322_10434 [Vibrio crassostreae]CAK1891371.1 hypothetical protein VCRA2113O326_10434 [Vibrio crassostreae]CAK1902060.1 hypothetical protein VCRA2113O363_10598 [Vibrio crassostreae]CAK1905462.1 hypothetical protein VCRA2113O358_10598 [Vibrio crassostreae]
MLLYEKKSKRKGFVIPISLPGWEFLSQPLKDNYTTRL